MTLSAILSCLWVIASTITAMLPKTHQYKPGLTLVIAAPVLILWLGYDYGWWVSGIGLLAFGSMFRSPLMYFYRRGRGQDTKVPE